MIWLDEWAFIKHNETMYEAMYPANSTASRIAKQNGTPYGLLITTTPSSLDDDSGRFFFQQMNEAAQWDEKIYDYYIDGEQEGNIKLEEFMDANSGNEFIYIEYSYKELGKDEAWLEKQKRGMPTLEAVKREILLEWAYSSDNSLFNEEQMTELSSYANRELFNTLEFEINRKKYYVKVIKLMDNMREKNWLVGIDMAGGLSRDNTAFTVVDPGTLEPVMTFKNNTIKGTDFRKLIKELIEFYIPNAVLIPERNYAGTTIIDSMINEDGLESNLFYSLKTRIAEKEVNTGGSLLNEIPRYGNRKVKKEVRNYGINTTKKSRDIMLNEILSMVVEDKPYLINNKDLFQEVKALQMIKGRIDHPDNGHDDLLMSYLFCLYAFYYEKDINKFVKVKYGTNLINSDNPEAIKKERDAKRKDISNIKRIGSIINGNESTNFPRKEVNERHKQIMNLF